MLEAALDYAGRGGPVFPCEPGGKRPLGRLVPHGLNDATTDSDAIRTWWSIEPRANIGLPAGLAFDVLDIDGPEALDGLEVWSEGGPGGDIEGPTVATPRGWHCYVAPTGRGNSVNIGGLAGIDWRGRGGYAVAPPSRGADGTSWDWITGTPQDCGADTPIVPAPEWVLALFDRQHPGPNLPRHAGVSPYGAAALERELGRLAVAQPGSRNHSLNSAAHALGQLVGGGVLDAEQVASSLVVVACRIGLPEAEARRTIASGLRAGLRSPRKVPS
jgi:hypothetical protein